MGLFFVYFLLVLPIVIVMVDSVIQTTIYQRQYFLITNLQEVVRGIFENPPFNCTKLVACEVDYE